MVSVAAATKIFFPRDDFGEKPFYYVFIPQRLFAPPKAQKLALLAS
jgi:asparagine synthetase B (glutamine-hydrolysing)